MKRWWLVIVLLLSVGINIGVLATLAVGRWAPSESLEAVDSPATAVSGEGEAFARRLTDRLRLKGETRERFLEIQTRFFSVVARERRRRARIERELAHELISPVPDPARAEKLVNELSRSIREMDLAFARSIIESRKLLNGKQEKEYLTFVRRWRGRASRPNGGDRRDPRFGRRRPG